MKVKIICPPPGRVPLDIRLQWVDVEIPLLGVESIHKPLGFRSGVENLGGYQVRPEHAVEALKKHNKPEAAKFWSNYLSAQNFTFKRDVCELINDDGSPLTFEQKFFISWYSISDDEKQIIVFPAIHPNEAKYNLRYNRLPNKPRRYSSIDNFVTRLEKGQQCAITFSPKQILKCSGISTIENKLVQDFIDSWTKNFKGLNLLIACKLVYAPERKKHREGENPKQKLQKIVGYIQRV
jgi:hypothetical protein